MMRKQIGVTLMVALIVVAVLAGGRAARADDDEHEVKGSITVDAAANAVTIDGTTLQVADTTRIEIGDARASLSDLAAFVSQNPNARAEAEFFDLNGQLVAKEIQ